MVALTREQVEVALEAQMWVFAKKMPHIPHEYALRKRWIGDVPFDDVVQFIRDHGERRRYGKASYVYFDLDGWKHWTMGARWRRRS